MEDRSSDVLFSNPFPPKRLDHGSKKSGFRFDLKNPLVVWILWIHGPFSDFRKKQEPQWLLARAKNVCDVLRIKVQRK